MRYRAQDAFVRMAPPSAVGAPYKRRMGIESGHRFAQMSDARLSLTLANDLGEIARMGLAVERFCGDHAIPIETIDALNIALDELVTNVIRYGFDDDDRHHIRVEIAIDDGSLVVEIADDGRPFDPFDRPSPDVDLPLEERPIGGLGIHFVRTLMDEASYRRDGGKNVVRMTKRVAT